MELPNPNIKKLLIFSYISRNRNHDKKFFIFQETELSHISGKRNPKKLLILQEVTFRARFPTSLKTSYIAGRNLQSLKIKNFLNFLKKQNLLN